MIEAFLRLVHDKKDLAITYYIVLALEEECVST
jgi:hypothetical protein